VLYESPHKESPKWSLDDGIIVRRKSNPKESTIEAWGLVDGMPTSKHYDLLVYDDVVTKESVSTPEMINKVTESFGLSLNLGKENGRKRIIGTRYHANDTYITIMKRNTAVPRIYPATEDGTFGGKTILITKETFERKVEDMGSYVASCQLLCNPLSDNAMGFKEEWLEYYNTLPSSMRMNYYITVDPAGEKKKTNDYTVMAVIGIANDKNYYLIDAVRDRMNLTERTEKLFELVRKYKPINVGYEKYGLQSDIEHIKYVQEQEGYRFWITALGGIKSKFDRIQRIVPLFEQHRFYLPRFLRFVDLQGKARDFIYEFIHDEYTTFPISSHDDMLDCISRVMDKELSVKVPKEQFVETPKIYNPLEIRLRERNVYDPFKILMQ
jgi:predicted phage terminase large subunit-like protein